MKNYPGRIILLVDDYEKAIAFYEQNFNFKKMYDVSTDVGQRFLHMGADPADPFGIWFLKADTKEQKARIGNQTAGQPTLVIYTTELQKLYDRVRKNNVTIKVEPVLTPEYSFFHCLDIFGNEIVIVALNEEPAARP